MKKNRTNYGAERHSELNEKWNSFSSRGNNLQTHTQIIWNYEVREEKERIWGKSIGFMGYHKRIDIHVMGVPEEERKGSKKRILKIMPKTSPNLGEEWTSTCSMLKRSHVESIQKMLHWDTLQLSEVKNWRILKAAGENDSLYYRKSS